MGLEVMTNFIRVIAVVDTVRSSYCSSHHDTPEAMENRWIEIYREYQFQHTMPESRYQMSLGMNALFVDVLWRRCRLLTSKLILISDHLQIQG